MKCEYCDNPVPNDVTRCPSCGAVVIMTGHDQSSDSFQCMLPQEDSKYMQSSMAAQSNYPLPTDRQSRMVYILLGFFLGSFGLHNFYAGYVVRGVVQLLLSIFSLGLLSWISWIWALVEIAIVSKNARGIQFC